MDDNGIRNNTDNESDIAVVKNDNARKVAANWYIDRIVDNIDGHIFSEILEVTRLETFQGFDKIVHFKDSQRRGHDIHVFNDIQKAGNVINNATAENYDSEMANVVDSDARIATRGYNDETIDSIDGLV